MPADDNAATRSTRTAKPADETPAILKDPAAGQVPCNPHKPRPLQYRLQNPRMAGDGLRLPVQRARRCGWAARARISYGYVIERFCRIEPGSAGRHRHLCRRAPPLLFLLSGLLGRTVARASAQVRSVESALARLSTPVDTLQGEVRQMADAVSLQVGRINTAMDSALARLAANGRGDHSPRR